MLDLKTRFVLAKAAGLGGVKTAIWTDFTFVEFKPMGVRQTLDASFVCHL